MEHEADKLEQHSDEVGDQIEEARRELEKLDDDTSTGNLHAAGAEDPEEDQQGA